MCCVGVCYLLMLVVVMWLILLMLLVVGIYMFLCGYNMLGGGFVVGLVVLIVLVL